MRDYLKESQEWLGSPKPLTDMLAEDRSALLATLVKYLGHSDIYKRKYAAFCLGQVGDDSVLPALQNAFNREPDGGGKDAMGAALAALKKMPASSGSTEEQRQQYVGEIYDKGIPDWVRQVGGVKSAAGSGESRTTGSTAAKASSGGCLTLAIGALVLLAVVVTVVVQF